MLSPLDIKVLRKGLVPLGSGVALALFLALPSQLYYISQSEHAQTQKRLMLAAQSRLSYAQESILIIKQYLPRFEHYLSRGIIGNERRLTWIDALRSCDAIAFDSAYSVAGEFAPIAAIRTRAQMQRAPPSPAAPLTRPPQVLRRLCLPSDRAARSRGPTPFRCSAGRRRPAASCAACR